MGKKAQRRKTRDSFLLALVSPQCSQSESRVDVTKSLPHVIYKVSRPYKKERQTQAAAAIEPRRPKG